MLCLIMMKKITGTELVLNSELIGNQPIKIKLSGHRAYNCMGSATWWEYNWYFSFCHNNQNYILLYNSCIQGEGWFLEETHTAKLNVTSSIVFQNVRDRVKGKWSYVELLSDHATIDKILGDRPRHCRGY